MSIESNACPRCSAPPLIRFHIVFYSFPHGETIYTVATARDTEGVVRPADTKTVSLAFNAFRSLEAAYDFIVNAPLFDPTMIVEISRGTSTPDTLLQFRRTLVQIEEASDAMPERVTVGGAPEQSERFSHTRLSLAA